MSNAFEIFRKNSRFFCLTVLWASILAVGCGRSRPDGMPPLVPCSASVVQDGKPLEGATVAFYSEAIPWSVSGTTDANGVAKIYTHGVYPGSPEGRFKVTVEKHVVEVDRPEGPVSASFVPKGAVGYDAVDLKFKSVDETPLTIDVSGKTKASFDVGGSIREKVEAL